MYREQTVKILSLRNMGLQWSIYPLDVISQTALFCSFGTSLYLGVWPKDCTRVRFAVY